VLAEILGDKATIVLSGMLAELGGTLLHTLRLGVAEVEKSAGLVALATTSTLRDAAKLRRHDIHQPRAVAAWSF
jgi:hypothetical protein